MLRSVRQMLPAIILLFAAPASAQIEFSPYIGLATGDQSVELVRPTDNFDRYAGDRLLAGFDLLFGAGQLVPVAGLAYRPTTYEESGGEDFRYDRLTLPLGFAYRLLAADFDINVVLHAAALPGISWGDDSASGQTLDHGLHWGARGGLTLYLGTVTLGGQYLIDVGRSGPVGGAGTTFVVTAGGRF
ncbi:hypothetical protein [Lewinella sp. JB7]|uniref:hypothetical protein n=1 Tax=Lewinella sp. JB7 TaxID=2962887 RepID=UPI0020C94C36|nr:hypothetical protein [Lewinella sp. JB7]MCP9236430.1 hypothetical protein [Lewinella sp. JB7]